MKHRILTATLIALSTVTAAQAATLTYLGPRGTYSDEAAQLAAAPHGWTMQTAGSITDVATQVVTGKTDYGLLPIENSSGGWVVETMKQFATGTPEWRVVGHVSLPITNVLMARPGATLAGITTIVSHPQPFLQSANYLKSTYPNVKRVEVTSTAAAAEQVSKLNDLTTAAIAAPAAAGVYGLQVLATPIQDDKRNTTKFWVVQRAPLPETGRVNHAVVVLTPAPGSDTLSSVIRRYAALGMNVQSLTNTPNGELGGARYVLAFQSRATSDVAQLRALLPAGADLIGAYRQ